MKGGVTIRAAIAGLLLASAAAGARAAEVVDADKAASVKAAYLLNFVKYTQWPPESFPAPDSPIVISVVGPCAVTPVLMQLAPQSEAATARGIRIEAPALPQAVADGQDPDWARFYEGLGGSHLVYLCGLDSGTAETVLRGLSVNDKLTVGDVPAFAERGGMLGFVLRENRILFEANLEAIRKSRIEVSAKVLQLAQIVGTKP